MGTQLPPPKKKGTATQFSAHVYCGQTVAYLSYCSAPVEILLDFSGQVPDGQNESSHAVRPLRNAPLRRVSVLNDERPTNGKPTNSRRMYCSCPHWFPHGLLSSKFSYRGARPCCSVEAAVWLVEEATRLEKRRMLPYVACFLLHRAAWNGLSPNLHNITDTARFKRSLKTHFLI